MVLLLLLLLFVVVFLLLLFSSSSPFHFLPWHYSCLTVLQVRGCLYNSATLLCRCTCPSSCLYFVLSLMCWYVCLYLFLYLVVLLVVVFAFSPSSHVLFWLVSLLVFCGLVLFVLCLYVSFVRKPVWFLCFPDVSAVSPKFFPIFCLYLARPDVYLTLHDCFCPAA